MAITVKVQGSVKSGDIRITDHVRIPGIVAGAAYTSGDAMGEPFWIDLKGARKGLIVGMLVGDLDKESLGFDLLLFANLPEATTDNAELDLSDNDRGNSRGYISITAGDYIALKTSSLGQVRDWSLPFDAPEGRIAAMAVTRGAPNYTAANDLSVALVLAVWE